MFELSTDELLSVDGGKVTASDVLYLGSGLCACAFGGWAAVGICAGVWALSELAEE